MVYPERVYGVFLYMKSLGTMGIFKLQIGQLDHLLL